MKEIWILLFTRYATLVNVRWCIVWPYFKLLIDFDYSFTNLPHVGIVLLQSINLGDACNVKWTKRKKKKLQENQSHWITSSFVRSIFEDLHHVHGVFLCYLVSCVYFRSYLCVFFLCFLYYSVVIIV